MYTNQAAPYGIAVANPVLLGHCDDRPTCEKQPPCDYISHRCNY